MVPGAWPDPWRGGKLERLAIDGAPRSRVRRRVKACGRALNAVGWPTLIVLGLALPQDFAIAHALTVAFGLTLVVAERLQEARARVASDDLAAFARALEVDDVPPSFSSTVLVPEIPPPLPPRTWRRPRRIEPTPVTPTSQRVTVPHPESSTSQRPTVPDSEREVHVGLLEQARSRR